MAKEVELFLAHYGVKGMRWGFRRRSDGSVVRSGKRVKSEDHVESRKLMKKHTSEMSNQDLKKLNNRLQLEVTYSELMAKQGSKVGRGQRFVKNVTNIGKTASEVYNLANSPMGKAIRKTVQDALK